MPIASAIRAASRVSSSVAGSRSAISEATFLPWRRLSPNSPRTALPTKRANWIGNGLSRPRSARSCWRCCGVASWPRMLVTGSPTYWNSMKAMNATVSMTRTAWTSRRRMKASTERERGGSAVPCGTPRSEGARSATRSRGSTARRCSRKCHAGRKGETTGRPQCLCGQDGARKSRPEGRLVVAMRRSAIRTSDECRSCSRSTCRQRGLRRSPCQAAPGTSPCPCS